MPYDSFGNEIDANGNPVQKKNTTAATLPTQDPNAQNATVALSPAAMSGAAVAPTAAGTQQGNTAVLAKAQTDVLNQPATSDLQNATTQQAQNFVQNPMGDFNPAKNKQQQLENADTNWANAYEQQRQQFGNVSGSGLLQQNMLQNALQHNVDKAALESNIDTENYNKYVDSMTKALAAGQSANQSNENIFSQRLGNLNTVRGMAEGEATRTAASSENALDRSAALVLQGNDIQGQKDITELQAKIQQGVLLQTQDFVSSQAALYRAQQLAVQNNEIQGQKDITKLRAELDAQAQAAQNEFANTQRLATQSWQTGERLSTQDYDKAKQYLNQQQQLALQSNDISAQKEIAKNRDTLELQMQTAEFTQEQKMAYLSNDLAEARANNDVTRQKTIIEFTTTQDMKKIEAEQGFQASQNYLDQQFKLAIQSNDIASQQTIQMMQITATASENEKNRALQSAELAMKQAGINYDMISAEVEAGRLDPAAAVDQIKQQLTAQGIDVSSIVPVDTTEAAKKAIQAQYDQSVYQFGQTYPELQGQALQDAYNKYFNETVYPASIITADLIADPTKLQGGASADNPNNASYVELAQAAATSDTFTMGYSYTDGARRFTGTKPAEGTIVKAGNIDSLWMGTSSSGTDVHDGKKTEWFEMRNINTGAVVRIWANNGTLSDQLFAAAYPNK